MIFTISLNIYANKIEFGKNRKNSAALFKIIKNGLNVRKLIDLEYKLLYNYSIKIKGENWK